MTLPSGRVLSYDDRFLPQKPGMKEVGMGLLGQAAGPIMGLGTLYGASKLGLLGGGGASAAATAGGAGALGAGGAAELASIPGIAGNAGVYGGEALSSGGVGEYLGGIGGTGNLILPGLGLLGAYHIGSNQDMSRGQGALEGMASGAAIGSFFGPIGAGVGAGIGGLGGLLATGKKTTRQRTNEKFDKLSDSAVSEEYKNMLDSARQQSLAMKGNDELDNKDALALSNTYAPLRTYGEDWAKLEEAQRRAIMEKALEENLIESRKGDYQFTDEARAKAIYDEIVKNKISSGI